MESRSHESSRWRIIAARTAGTSHLVSGTPCQDAFAFKELIDGTLLIALSDGAGSAARSHEGSSRAVAQALASIERAALLYIGGSREWERVMRTAFADARADLSKLAGGDDLSDFEATLSCAVVTTDLLIVGQIGDAATVAEREDRTLVLAHLPQRGEYANESHFLTQANALEKVAVVVQTGKVYAVSLLSDGLMRLALSMQNHSPHEPFFRPLLAFTGMSSRLPDAAADLAAFIASDRVNSRTDDDKSIVLAVRSGYQPAPPG
jgi:hypothetical protein